MQTLMLYPEGPVIDREDHWKTKEPAESVIRIKEGADPTEREQTFPLRTKPTCSLAYLESQQLADPDLKKQCAIDPPQW